MERKCVRRGCGKVIVDEQEPCVFHPGAPEFHEGRKGWICCKPRVLAFDEFLAIPPCTTGLHSTTEYPPEVPVAQSSAAVEAANPTLITAPTAGSMAPLGRAPRRQLAPAPPPPPPVPVETDEDDDAVELPDGQACRRRTCKAKHKAGRPRADTESCVYHPGVPLFHEGTKGYSCCKRRVLEFDQFLSIDGCATKNRHLFIGSGKKKVAAGSAESRDGEQLIDTIRHDFYQTVTCVIASFFLKKIDKNKSKISFQPQEVELDLVTLDSPPKRHMSTIPLFAPIDPHQSKFLVLGTKLEITLQKEDSSPWQTLRSDEAHTGEILQIGNAGHA